MNYLSKRLTLYILKKELICLEDFEIYQYGFQHFLELLTSIICSLIIAFALNMKLECLVFFLFFIPLRSYGGGLHLKTYLSCLLFSCFTLAGILLLIKHCSVPVFLSFAIYVIALILLKIIGPVDHPNRKVEEAENLLFSRRTNLMLLASIPVAALFTVFNFRRYILLEASVFVLVAITSFIGKILYKNTSFKHKGSVLK